MPGDSGGTSHQRAMAFAARAAEQRAAATLAQATVVYTTGEVEVIDLDEIARDNHLSLIHQQDNLW